MLYLYSSILNISRFMNKLLVSAYLFFVGIVGIQAQDTIVSTDGELINAREIRLQDGEFFYKNVKGAEKIIDSEDVFSIIDSTGKKTVYYKQDTTKGFYETEEDMQLLIDGMVYANKHYKAPNRTYVGGAVGFGAITVISLTGIGGLFFSPVIPVAYCAGVVVSKPNVEKLKAGLPQSLAASDKFVTGYIAAVKHKRVKNAIFGSIGGLGVGALLFTLLNL